MRRFSELDPAYLERLQAFSAQAGPRELWSTIWQFPLFAEEYALARCVKIADLLRSTLEVPGNVAEFGSWEGANLLYLAKLLRVFDPNSPKRTHCFESFAGLDRFTAADGEADRFAGTYRGSREQLEQVIALFAMEQEIVIHDGDIVETLPRVLAEAPGLRFSFVYCDVDLHAPTAAILEHVHARLNPGGLFVFDEYGWDEFAGETLAVHAFLEQHRDAYDVEYLRDTRQPTMALRRRP